MQGAPRVPSPRMTAPTAEPRRLLLDAYSAALAAVSARGATDRVLAGLVPGPRHAIALGKAAEGMLRAALARDMVVRALVAAPLAAPADLAADPRVAWHRGGHPLPDAGSLAAGAAVERFVAATPADARVLALLSGGASACCEAPREGVDLGQLREVANAGWSSGDDIRALNRRRAALSRLKAGGLAALIAPRALDVVLISDVDGAPEVVGSGPFWDGRAPHHVAADNAVARRAVAAWCATRGIECIAHEALSGDAAETGRRIAAELARARPGLHLWGGECTVRVPARAGRGGRCQHLALAASCQGLPAGAALLALGTDGRDGPGTAAGALVDPGTPVRLRDAGIDADAALAACDSGAALAAAGDLVDTGATGTNVADLVLAWVAPAHA